MASVATLNSLVLYEILPYHHMPLSITLHFLFLHARSNLNITTIYKVRGRKEQMLLPLNLFINAK